MYIEQDCPSKSLYARCECCGDYGTDCGHLLVALEANGNSVVAGALKNYIHAYLDAFIELGKFVIDRGAVCGTGIVRKAMTQIDERWGPGISVDQLLDEVLTRDFA
jgi:hypothetical protein